MKKKSSSSVKFSEWQLLRQECDAFERTITQLLGAQGFYRVRVFAVGSPRNFQVVVKAHYEGQQFFKRIRRSIRDSSHQFWVENFTASPWENVNHQIDESQF